MECVDDVDEAQLGCGADELILVQLTPVKRAAGVEKLAGLGGCLLVDKLQVVAQELGERGREFLERHAIVCPVGEAEEALCQAKFVGRHVAAEQHNRPPIGVERGSFCEKIGQAVEFLCGKDQPSLSSPLRLRMNAQNFSGATYDMVAATLSIRAAKRTFSHPQPTCKDRAFLLDSIPLIADDAQMEFRQ